ncbi:Uncharacterised protein [uncultured archaeon]|nr:Uncharacterised protein [uncultured archaeon]
MRAIIVLAIFIFASLCAAFDLSPANPNSGDRITLSGSASPGERLSFHSSFSMDLPVTGGQYEYTTAVEIPRKPNRFTVTARNVKYLNAGVKLGIWLTRQFPASGGIASISHADVPPGKYDLKMFGEALAGSTSVPVEVVAETVAQADSKGKYELFIDTSGIPAGDYRIEGAGDLKTIRIREPSATSISAASQPNRGDEGGDDHVSSADKKEMQVEITPKVIQWYAIKIGLKVENKSQYDEAERLLNKRLSGGYWKVIIRGEPLTEEAGNCEQEYCLVRGVDACTVCREKDMPIKNKSSVNLSITSDVDATKEDENSLSRNISMPQSGESSREKGFIGMIINWVKGLLGMHSEGWGW